VAPEAHLPAVLERWIGSQRWPASIAAEGTIIRLGFVPNNVNLMKVTRFVFERFDFSTVAIVVF
jgi:hypothetical protein